MQAVTTKSVWHMAAVEAESLDERSLRVAGYL
jgi:hypothetical protein